MTELLILTTNGKLDCYSTLEVWNMGDPIGELLVLPCPVIKVNGKLQQLNPGRTTNGPDPSEMKT